MDHDWLSIASIIGLVLVALGLLMNGICAYATRTPELNSLSTINLLLGALVSDMVLLVIGSFKFIGNLCEDLTETYILHGGDTWRCRFAMFFEGNSKIVSTWLLVAIIAEAMLGTYHAEKRTHIYSKKRALYITGYVYLLAFVATILYTIIIRSEQGFCTSVYPEFYEVYKHGVLDLALTVIIPMLLIAICFIVIIVALKTRSSHESSKRGQNETIEGVSLDWNQRFWGFSVTCGAIYILCAAPWLGYNLVTTLERFNLVTPHSWWTFVQDNEALVSTVAYVVFLVPFVIKPPLLFLFESTFRRALGQLCTYQAETLSMLQRRQALSGGNKQGPIEYSKGKGFLKGVRRSIRRPKPATT